MKITRRTKNFGYALSTQAVQTSHGLAVVSPEVPQYVGTPRQVYALAVEARRLYASGGTCYREAIFVGGRRVLSVAGYSPSLGEVMMYLEHGEVEVEVE